MRTVIALGVGLLASPALASPGSPVTVRGETIEIEGRAPVVVPPRPAKNYHRIAPRYSDYAIEHDVWTRAWVLLEIDERGDVARMKVLRHPGAELELYAIDYAFGMHFAPAIDGNGHATRTLYLTSIEWPSYWWMIAREGVATKLPGGIEFVPCRGSGPMHLGSIHPAYRDCSEPDLAKAATEPWITHSR